MRLEEMTSEDIRQLGAFCDTALFTIGGASWRPAHLPIGTSWYILRRLRDQLDASLGGRMITLPVFGVNVQGEEGSIFQIPKDGVIQLIRHSVKDILERLPLRFLVFLTDSLDSEQVIKEAIDPFTLQNNIQFTSFIWWRDGFSELTEQQYHPSGELETSLMLTFANRLIDLEQKSATRYGALHASEESGTTYWKQIEKSSLEHIQTLWGGGNG